MLFDRVVAVGSVLSRTTSDENDRLGAKGEEVQGGAQTRLRFAQLNAASFWTSASSTMPYPSLLHEVESCGKIPDLQVIHPVCVPWVGI